MLSSMANLALVLRGQGKYEAAEEVHQQALEPTEKVLGPEHPSTLTSMDNLALVLDSQGKYKAAERRADEHARQTPKEMSKDQFENWLWMLNDSKKSSYRDFYDVLLFLFDGRSM
jgi:Flp pilus assembly protein TadD